LNIPPLELIADWLVARYPFEALAYQLCMTPKATEELLGCLLPEPATVTIREPTAAASEEENRLQREWLKALIAERSAPSAKLDWTVGDKTLPSGGDISTAGVTIAPLPAISATRGPRVNSSSLHLRFNPRPPRADNPWRLEAERECNAKRQYLRGRPKQRVAAAAGQKVRSEKAAARRAEIVRLHDEGRKQDEIALILGITTVTIWRALKSRRNAP
jgi:predicted DNA-binding protein (UPF0251 family)